MRPKCGYYVDGAALLAPDQDLKMSFEDIDAHNAGRDEAGVMHRVPVRRKVGSWTFTYGTLTGAEFDYMESVFGDKTTFTFTTPKGNHTCYRTKYGVSFHSARTDLWKGYSFTVIEC